VYDVIVVGGGAAGVGAAVGATQAGASCLLVESGPCLGGAATQKNVLTYCGLYTQAQDCRQAVGGVAEAVLEKLRRLGGVAGPVRLPPPSSHVIAAFDPEAVKLALDRITSAAQVRLLLHTTAVAAERLDDAISEVTLQDHGGAIQVRARTFVDASGEGDLSAFGGVSVRYGNRGKAQVGSLGVRFGGTPPNYFSAQEFEEAIQRAKQIGTTLLNKEHGLLLKLPISGDSIAYYIDASYDALDSESLTGAEIAGREKAWAYLEAARTIKACEGMYITSTGPQFGTRESRHINSQHTLTQDDVVQGTKFDDVVALGAWPVEYHSGEDARQFGRTSKVNIPSTFRSGRCAAEIREILLHAAGSRTVIPVRAVQSALWAPVSQQGRPPG